MAVVINNCVINLSSEKEKPSDEARDRVEKWSDCICGALEKAEYEALLKAAGFEEVSVEATHSYQPEQGAGSLSPESVEALREVSVASAFVRGRKPAERGYN
ncbi:MAG: hypothetical protein AVDCRST_MAG28-4137 [uncultured Rubrobacteraceae bacterium]|uniref:Uncharacterized protein n=1 Tax=uncultured Rubrobacteraceae bacterium TaxID=349277 RepID=A0A6J4R7H3_9ACTN|nr:MAG: hypothetical protein AVDCRST_MAG28-4137 [uncultured Rubrobacteraceae bacterium]